MNGIKGSCHALPDDPFTIRLRARFELRTIVFRVNFEIYWNCDGQRTRPGCAGLISHITPLERPLKSKYIFDYTPYK